MQLLAECNPCDRNDSLNQHHLNSSDMEERDYVKRLLSSDTVELNTLVCLVNRYQFNGPSTSQLESTFGNTDFVNSFDVVSPLVQLLCSSSSAVDTKPDRPIDVMSAPHTVATTDSGGERGRRERMDDEIPQSTINPNSLGTECRTTAPTYEGSLGNIRIDKIHASADLENSPDVVSPLVSCSDTAVDTVEPDRPGDIISTPHTVATTASQGEKGSSQTMADELPQPTVEPNRLVTEDHTIETATGSLQSKHMEKMPVKLLYTTDNMGRPTSSHICPVCKKVFRTEHNLKSHMRVHSDDRPYTCYDCGDRFRTSTHLKQHMLVHTGLRKSTTENMGRPKCRECGAVFKCKAYLKVHVGIHTGEKPHKCSFCDRTFRLKHEHTKHERHHRGELPQCPVCGGRYVSLQKHMSVHSADTSSHVCSVCKKVFHTEQYLKSHMRVHSGDRRYTCYDCGGQFRTSTHLKKHMLVHTGLRKKSHVCNVCGKMFEEGGSLRIHMRTHTDERPFRCETCGKAFTQKHMLDVHRRIHTSEKPFVCATCGKQFSRDIALWRHNLIHTGEQPYECSVCGMRFNQSCSVKRHMLVHTGEKPYSCSDCGERFTQSGGLASHRRRHCPSLRTARISCDN